MTTTINNVLSKIFKRLSRDSASVLQKLFSESIEKKQFPQKLKLDNFTPLHKKNDP